MISRRNALKGLGALGAASVVPGTADAACCYFAAQEKDINQPGQKAFLTWDASRKFETFTVQPKFEGNAVDFGMVVPTPSQPKLDEMPRDFFKDLAIYTILMPLPQAIWLEEIPVPKSAGVGFGGGGAREKGGDKKGVRVLEAGVVGSLDYKIIVADDANGLYDWLKENGYVYSGDEATLGFYIQKKWFFTVMKIDPRQMKKNDDGSYQGEVTPTKFSFESERCVYPLKITQISVKDQTDALFYVQSSEQMDLEGDLSWMHSYRVMWLTYMLGCSANAEQQKELEERNAWVASKKRQDPKFETTKLEWARKLGDAELAVVEDPLKNYAQMGGGDLPQGDKVVPFDEFLKEARTVLEKQHPGEEGAKHVEQRMKELEARYKPEKGQVVKAEKPNPFFGTSWMWYPNREAPEDAVKGLSRLKGHLQKGQWVTKFRKILRKDEMTGDLALSAVPSGKEQDYVRIMPTSPP